ncbi:MAG: ATP-binding cassette domain-containing protein [Chitinophagales bacterium]|nr:ATP-binding cassette domain-containing protein [Bacteroidota bacterium]MCB9256955.1 ATP-binding cassette domain-containing protein [Chitinophagales bacterium]
MLTANNISLQFGKRVLFDEVNVQFTKGNCYGIIGANGAGKSTFLKILTGEQDPTSGSVELEAGARLSVLKQNHFAYDNYSALETVIMGHTVLYAIMKEKDALYAKEDFTEEDGIKAGDLEAEFADLNGWNAESDASELLSNLGISKEKQEKLMSDLTANEKIRVLLAQAIFGDPDVLVLDEPTNDLDVETISWLENFLADYQNTVIVVSHDRHFLDAVCTHVADIDFGKIQLFTGNYSFWYESSQLILSQRASKNKKAEEKIKELKDFIARFSANAAKSKQATSRKKALDKINVDEMKASSRKYPAIIFMQERELGNQILQLFDLGYEKDGEVLFSGLNLNLTKGDKVGVISRDSRAVDAFYKILSGELKPTSGRFEWGVTVKHAYLPNENSEFFEGNDANLIDWLRQYSTNKEEAFVRGFLGKMLFTGEESFKSVKVLSGGEKVRCMVSRIMLQQANVILLNEPTSHLDLESITAFNNGVKDFQGVALLTTQDHHFMQTSTNRIFEFGPNGCIDKQFTTFDDYISDDANKARREALYQGVKI